MNFIKRFIRYHHKMLSEPVNGYEVIGMIICGLVGFAIGGGL